MHTNRRVRITVRGRIGARLAASFDGFTIVRHEGGTDLVGRIADQAQLHGILTRIRDLGLELEGVTTSRAGIEAAAEPERAS